MLVSRLAAEMDFEMVGMTVDMMELLRAAGKGLSMVDGKVVYWEDETGLREGRRYGCIVGCFEGLEVGFRMGCFDGMQEGCRVGKEEGFWEGCCVGIAEGCRDG